MFDCFAWNYVFPFMNGVDTAHPAGYFSPRIWHVSWFHLEKSWRAGLREFYCRKFLCWLWRELVTSALPPGALWFCKTLSPGHLQPSYWYRSGWADNEHDMSVQSARGLKEAGLKSKTKKALENERGRGEVQIKVVLIASKSFFYQCFIDEL